MGKLGRTYLRDDLRPSLDAETGHGKGTTLEREFVSHGQRRNGQTVRDMAVGVVTDATTIHSQFALLTATVCTATMTLIMAVAQSVTRLMAGGWAPSLRSEKPACTMQQSSSAGL